MIPCSCADVHREYARDYMREMRRGARSHGRRQRRRRAARDARGRFPGSLCAALESPLGVGGARYRPPRQRGSRDTVFLGAFRRSVFETVGMYDPRRDHQRGRRAQPAHPRSRRQIYLSREIVVHYFPRDSYSKLAQAVLSYGRGRARTALKHRGLPVRPPPPPVPMVIGGTTMAATPPLMPFAPIAFALYAASTGVEAVRVGRSAGLSAVPLVRGISRSCTSRTASGSLQASCATRSARTGARLNGSRRAGPRPLEGRASAERTGARS